MEKGAGATVRPGEGGGRPRGRAFHGNAANLTSVARARKTHGAARRVPRPCGEPVLEGEADGIVLAMRSPPTSWMLGMSGPPAPARGAGGRGDGGGVPPGGAHGARRYIWSVMRERERADPAIYIRIRRICSHAPHAPHGLPGDAVGVLLGHQNGTSSSTNGPAGSSPIRSSAAC